jgi:sigma-E factor negative regulatory protein RseC
MIKETATVIAVDGDQVRIEAQIKSTCASCQASDNCGTSTVAKAFAPKSQQLTLATPVPVKVGDLVSVGIPEQGVLMASGLLYVAPLLLFISSAFLFTAVLPWLGIVGELWVLLCALVTTLFGFVLLSGVIKRLDKHRFQPVILSRITPRT